MTNTQTEKLILIDELNRLERKLETLVYGSVEIRTVGENRYIYVHYRSEGRQTTRYVGEYDETLHRAVLDANREAREIKKKLRFLRKELALYGHVDSTPDPAVAENIDFARRVLVDSIYRQSVLEGIATTYADTETIVEGGKVFDMAADDVHKILNLKHAWQFVLNKDVVASPTDYALLTEINRMVIEGFYYSAGRLRTVPVSIGGTSWTPRLPIEADVRETIEALVASDRPVEEKAADIVLYVMKAQPFIDGNKRTAILFANHLLVSHARGLLIVPAEEAIRFKDLLIVYYETGDDRTIKAFLLERCLRRLHVESSASVSSDGR